MPKFSKIFILVFLTLFVSLSFNISFSNAQETEGTVYVCPQATSMGEIDPRCPGKIIIKLGETINELTLTTTIYEGEEYYMVLGFTNGGGAVNLPPIADAGGPYEGYGGLPINFDASSSTDPNGDPLQYRWDFNSDGVWDTDWLTTSTVNHIWNDDYEGIVKLEVSDGEFNATASTSIKIKSPKSFKQDAVSELESAKTGNKINDKKIDLIISFINKSLNNDLWIDSSHLVFFEKGKCNNFEETLKSDELDFKKLEKNCPRLGIMVFYYEKMAVELMMLKQEFKEIIEKLVKTDSLLAKVSLSDAKNTPINNPKFQKIVTYQIQKAEEELIKAEKELSKNKPNKAISRFAKSWLHSQLAIKFANL